jgi:predicted permease
MLYIGYIILGAVAITIFFIAFLFSKLLLRNEKETQLLTKITFSLAITFSFSLLLMICVDDFDVNTMPTEKSKSHEVEVRQQLVKWTYYLLFIAIFITMLILSPFSYFFYEEGFVNFNILNLICFSGDEEATCGRRTCRALRYVIIILIIFIIIFVVGFFIRSSPKGEPGDWMNELLGQQGVGDRAIQFLVAVFMFICLDEDSF